MREQKVIIEAYKSGYSTGQVVEENGTMTVGELVEYLGAFEPETRIYLSFDNGSTYGGITDYNFRDEYDDDDTE